ncbi:MAG: RHS repeat-associated core domain-containing protein [Caldilineaceae bacterium]
MGEGQTDRTFTGQKADGTGLLYYNARYYDPALGTFLSPDTLVPDAGRVVDYNRFLYARENPLKYSDPDGHCATITNGEPDMDGDSECWQMANAIAGLGYTEQGFWDDWGGKNRSDWWLSNIANQSFATVGYLKPFYEKYNREFEGRTGLTQPVSLEPVVNPKLHQPGEELILTAGRDAYACTHSVTDCGNAMDGLSTTLSGVAMGCLVAGFAPCAGAASTAGNFVDVAGIVLTAHNTVKNGDSYVDLIVAIGGTSAGMAYGDLAEGTVGFGISLIQWMYGHQESH